MPSVSELSGARVKIAERKALEQRIEDAERHLLRVRERASRCVERFVRHEMDLHADLAGGLQKEAEGLRKDVSASRTASAEHIRAVLATVWEIKRDMLNKVEALEASARCCVKSNHS
jgi:hypothetical protein